MDSNHKYITDLYDRWMVKIRTSEGMFTKSFTFKKYGNKKTAFSLALKWRNETLKKMNMLNVLNYAKRPDMCGHAININPIIGVYITTSNKNKNKNWCARW